MSFAVLAVVLAGHQWSCFPDATKTTHKLGCVSASKVQRLASRVYNIIVKGVVVPLTYVRIHDQQVEVPAFEMALLRQNRVLIKNTTPMQQETGSAAVVKGSSGASATNL